MAHADILSSRRAYQRYAADYDALNAHAGYRRWITGLEAVARRHGLCGHTALDVACGTGESMLPLLDAGYDVCGVDAVPEMLAVCAAKTAGRARLVEADLAALPQLGAFSYATCLNDPLNYLTTTARLHAALAGIARNLAPGGIAVFDTNNPATFRGVFSSARGDAWRGHGCAVVDGRLVGRATVALPGGATSEHVQVHHADADVSDGLRYAGLELLARYGQHDDGRRDDHVDPDVHPKTIWVARRPVPRRKRR